MRQIDDAAEREDQREAKRDEQIIGADQEAVENLLEDKDQLHAMLELDSPASFRGGRERHAPEDRTALRQPILQVPSFGGAMTSMSSFGPGTAPSAS